MERDAGDWEWSYGDDCLIAAAARGLATKRAVAVNRPCAYPPAACRPPPVAIAVQGRAGTDETDIIAGPMLQGPERCDAQHFYVTTRMGVATKGPLLGHHARRRANHSASGHGASAKSRTISYFSSPTSHPHSSLAFCQHQASFLLLGGLLIIFGRGQLLVTASSELLSTFASPLPHRSTDFLSCI